MKSRQTSVSEALTVCCRVLDEKKAGDLTVLDVSAQSSITDYLVVATATSVPHLRALRVELEKALDATNTHIVGMETPEDSGWMVIDAFDVMIHLFLAETRERYGLERLWRDATEVSVAKLLGHAKPKAKAPRERSAAVPRKRRPKG
jgi:ribosome-associated protein